MCETLPDISFADFNNNPQPPFRIGDEIQFHCKYGFKGHIFFNSAKCVLEKGTPTWEWDRNACVPNSCEPLDYIENGHIIGDNYTYPNSVTYQCNEGYTLLKDGQKVASGKFKTFCNDKGWTPDPENLICEPVSCLELKNPTNGAVHWTNLLYKGIATYTCDAQFTLKGDPSRVCEKDGLWSGQAPMCERITCPSPDRNGKMIPQKPIYYEGDVLLYECPLTNQSVLAKCLKSGVWSSQLPDCSPKTTETNLFWIFIPVLLLFLWIFLYGIHTNSKRPKK